LTHCSQRMSRTLRTHCSLPGLAGKPASPGKANKARLYSLMHTQIIRSAVFKAPHRSSALSGTRRRGFGTSHLTVSGSLVPNLSSISEIQFGVKIFARFFAVDLASFHGGG